MASVRIIPAVTDGKGGRRPRSNRRRAEKALPVATRSDGSPRRDKSSPDRSPKAAKPRDRAQPKPEPVPQSQPTLKALPPVQPVRLAVQPVPTITTGPLAAWDPDIAEAILMALAAYNALRKADPDLTTVGMI